MMGKLWRAIVSLTVYACVATLIAELIVAVCVVRAWRIDRPRLIQTLAAAQGIDLAALRQQAGADAGQEPSTEQASYNQVLEARAMRARNLELREQSLRSALERVGSERRKLVEEKTRLQKLREAFQSDLAALESGALGGGREDARRTLEAIKPKQAKELLMQMLERNELDEVAVLLEGMTESKRAKIFAEFKAPAEVDSLGEVLRRIRRGEPAARVAKTTEQKIGQ